MYAREKTPLALWGQQSWQRPVQSIHPVQCEYVRQQLHATLTVSVTLTLPICRLNRERKCRGRQGYPFLSQRLRSLMAGNLLSAWCTLSLSAASPHTTFAHIQLKHRYPTNTVMIVPLVCWSAAVSQRHGDIPYMEGNGRGGEDARNNTLKKEQ